MTARLAKAIAVVAALVLAVPCSGVVCGRVSDEQPAGSAPAGIGAAALIGQGGDAQDLIERIEEAADGGIGQPPAWFSEEIGVLPDARDVRASGAVVGYMVDAESQATLEALRMHMEGRGWTCVPSTEAGAATFVKESGQCTWAFATCVQVGPSTSVVVMAR